MKVTMPVTNQELIEAMLKRLRNVIGTELIEASEMLPELSPSPYIAAYAAAKRLEAEQDPGSYVLTMDAAIIMNALMSTDECNKAFFE